MHKLEGSTGEVYQLKAGSTDPTATVGRANTQAVNHSVEPQAAVRQDNKIMRCALAGLLSAISIALSSKLDYAAIPTTSLGNHDSTRSSTPIPVMQKLNWYMYSKMLNGYCSVD